MRQPLNDALPSADVKDAPNNDASPSFELGGSPNGPHAKLGKSFKMSCRAKICICCCASTVVLLGVTIPVGLFVIAPMVAQHILDSSEFNLRNSTMRTCASLHAEGINTVSISNPGMFSTTVHPFQNKMIARGCNVSGEWKSEWSCEKPESVELGYFTSPDMHLKPGANNVTFAVRINLHDATMLTNLFVVPLFFEDSNATMTIEGEGVSLTALGLSLNDLHMRKTMTCRKVEILPYAEIPDKFCRDVTSKPQANSPHIETKGRRLDASSGYVISCAADHKGSEEFHLVV